ncbi:protein of unknown function (DUF2223) [Halobacteroides halobius DSM 5150]|uniref:Glucodextranase-like C-terminal domain-containing protein n=1 Tax=Halobacteroides halobius (strain ATCC 35273 / DSM 5150 / MD-1) TaxID=748449 RepID=L0KCA4_HALHC|nr:glucodextranase DOMON-like domain-containing protein [Halobacteroides halobius]AGB42004.1 protein of unknown function (DUF2223) [Halobacteroides halobius DSM 5150]
MTRKLRFSLLMLIIIMLLSPVIRAEEKSIFKLRDPVGDEYGPGSYTYPTSEQFSPYEGLFDLMNFKVEATADKYNFYFKFVEVTNPWHAPYGFSHQLIQVYIDNQDGGITETFKPGARVKFEEQHPWDKLLKITGWSVELYSSSDKAEVENRVQEAQVKLNDKTIKLTIPKEKIGDLKEAHYYVLVGGLDGFGYDNYRPVVEEAQGWKFGGGTDTELNPNVIDTLVPEGMSQKEILGSFDLDEGRVATLRAVGPDLSLSLKFMIIIGFIVILVLTLVGAVFKFVTNRIGNFR